LFTVLAKASAQRLSRFDVQNLANTAWASATAGESDALLFAALAEASTSQMAHFSEQ